MTSFYRHERFIRRNIFVISEKIAFIIIVVGFDVVVRVFHYLIVVVFAAEFIDFVGADICVDIVVVIVVTLLSIISVLTVVVFDEVVTFCKQLFSSQFVLLPMPPVSSNIWQLYCSVFKCIHQLSLDEGGKSAPISLASFSITLNAMLESVCRHSAGYDTLH